MAKMIDIKEPQNQTNHQMFDSKLVSESIGDGGDEISLNLY